MKIKKVMDPLCEHVVVRGDQYRVHQILDKFLSNAIEFTQTEVKISLKHTQCTMDTISFEFAVQDDGPGLSIEEISEAFTFPPRKWNDIKVLPSSRSVYLGVNHIGLSVHFVVIINTTGSGGVLAYASHCVKNLQNSWVEMFSVNQSKGQDPNSPFLLHCLLLLLRKGLLRL